MRARFLFLLPGLASALTLPATAQELDRLQAHFGAVTYAFYCEACHGETGKGDGPAAASLTVKPADLTTLAARNGGTFPAERVAAAIDGRVEVVGHVDLAMPPWAQLFAHELDEFPPGTILDALVERRIAHLVAYIATLQAD
ncbi:c-type cytochrome [Devosia sp.]|uniref:c-type cytochrome n=1 Tax=Devosia sp. TaxID=1871048 RepID=UPI002F11505F